MLSDHPAVAVGAAVAIVFLSWSFVGLLSCLQWLRRPRGYIIVGTPPPPAWPREPPPPDARPPWPNLDGGLTTGSVTTTIDGRNGADMKSVGIPFVGGAISGEIRICADTSETPGTICVGNSPAYMLTAFANTNVPGRRYLAYVAEGWSPDDAGDVLTLALIRSGQIDPQQDDLFYAAVAANAQGGGDDGEQPRV